MDGVEKENLLYDLELTRIFKTTQKEEDKIDKQDLPPALRDEKDLSEKYIQRYLQYVCPKCGKEFSSEVEVQNHTMRLHPDLQNDENLKKGKFSTLEAVCSTENNVARENNSDFQENDAKLRLLSVEEVKYSASEETQANVKSLPFKSYKCLCHNYYYSSKYSAVVHLMFQRKRRAEKQGVIDAQQLPTTIQPEFSSPKPISVIVKNNQPHKGFKEESIKDTNIKSETIEPDNSFFEESTMQPLFSVLSTEDYKNHDWNPEMDIEYSCSECGETLADKNHWMAHCNTFHNFNSEEGLNMTRISKHTVQCNECSVIISGKCDNYKMRRHRLTHSPYKAFGCRICKQQRKRKEDVVQHIRAHHRPPQPKKIQWY